MIFRPVRCGRRFRSYLPSGGEPKREGTPDTVGIGRRTRRLSGLFGRRAQGPAVKWLPWALCSALFAGLTAILAKVGEREVASDFATAVRTTVILAFAWGSATVRVRSSSPALEPALQLRSLSPR